MDPALRRVPRLSSHLHQQAGNLARHDTFELEIDMKVEELIGSKVWIRREPFRSFPGKIESMSNAVNLEDIKSSVTQSTFRVEMLSGDVIEIPGSDISKIDHAGYIQQSRPA